MICIPRDSNLRYLPLMYFLPEDLIVKCPTLCSLPRKVREIIYDEAMMKIVESDQFLNQIMDASAALAFPHFGFGGWKEHYTGYSPVWQLSYALATWADLLEKEIGWNLQKLFQFKSTEIIPFFEPDYIKEVMGKVVERAIKENNMQPIFDVVREMPCDEDFEKWNTNVRKDFIRKWYHTRSKKVQTISLDACMEEEDKSVDFEENVASENFCQRFKARLSEKNMKILELRIAGFTYEEIAEKLGYKNHSGVIKRMNTIKEEFIKYEKEQ